MSEVFTSHKDQLENLFFQNSADRDKAREEKAVEALSLISGIKDEKVLNHMVDLGIKSDTLTALSLFPLIHIAWADEELDEKERKAVLKGAEQAGIYAGSHGYMLLDSWMSQEPSSALYSTWSDYIKTLCANLPADEIAIIKDQLVGRANKIAEASGGFTKRGSVSQDEKNALARLENAFNH